MYGNCGYKIIIKKTNYKIFHITDVASLDHIEAKNYDFYAVEANYNEDDLLRRIQEKQEQNIFSYEFRLPQTHLSEEQWNKFMLENAGDNSECIKIHQHKERKEKNDNK